MATSDTSSTQVEKKAEKVAHSDEVIAPEPADNTP